jgi:hypothetical protein
VIDCGRELKMSDFLRIDQVGLHSFGCKTGVVPAAIFHSSVRWAAACRLLVDSLQMRQYGLGFAVWGLVFRVWDLVFRVLGFGLGV